jgi:hypothetical protein
MFYDIYNNLNISMGQKLDGIFDLKRNSTGHVVQLAGPLPLALDWLSYRYNFT